jgi:hypothetical protein
VLCRDFEYCKCPVVVARSVPEVEAWLEEHGVSLRGRVMA